MPRRVEADPHVVLRLEVGSALASGASMLVPVTVIRGIRVTPW